MLQIQNPFLDTGSGTVLTRYNLTENYSLHQNADPTQVDPDP